MEFLKLNELAVKLGLKPVGNSDREIAGVSSPEYPMSERICVIWEHSAARKLPLENPIIGKEEYFDEGRDGLIAENPRAMLPEVLRIFQPSERKKGIDPRAVVICEKENISPEAYIAPNAYIGEGCEIGEGTVIEPNAVLLRNVKIGRNCLVHSGAVIGADGFGFERTPEGLVKIPQTGGVSIGDDVEIGACSTIDRGTMNDTVIGSGTKIDNQVQIGHNVKIGRNCIICSMSGIAGSSELGDNVIMAVQAGVSDHVKVGSNVVIAGRSGITSDIPDNSRVSGFPARNHNDAKRALVLAADLPLLVKRLKLLEKKVDLLQNS